MKNVFGHNRRMQVSCRFALRVALDMRTGQKPGEGGKNGTSLNTVY